VRHAYGDHPAQFGELTVPHAPRRPGTVVVLHGGFWKAEYDLSLGRPLAADLVARGYAVWNLEYRRVGDGGGWPATFEDVAAGIDALADLDVDAAHVVTIGHSAGGHLALWAAGRAKLLDGAVGAAPRVAVTGVVSQAGVLSLVSCAEQAVGGTAASGLMGGMPGELPERYRIGDPLAAVPIPAPVLCVHARSDDVVPFSQSVEYVDAATRAGGHATLREVAGDHFTVIDPTSSAWTVVVDALPDLMSA
jgi:acetyl esterase/lipase